MAIGSDNKNPKLYLTTGVTPATPSSGDWKLYAKANGIFAMGSNASEIGPFGASGLTNPMTTQGDVIYSSDNSGTPARLAESSNASKILTSGGSGANPSWGQGPMTTTGDLMIGASGGVPTRLAVGAAGTVLGGGTTPAYATPPGYEIDYVEFTSNVTLSATTEATANTIVTSSTIAYDGSTIVLIHYYCPVIYAGAILTVRLWLYEKVGAGAPASIGKIGEFINPAAADFEVPTFVLRRRTPSAASIVYSIRGSTSTGSPVAVAGAGGTATAMPGFIRITKV